MGGDVVNPYIAGNPVTGADMFFGRQDVFDFINNSLIGRHQDNIIVLFGQRRTGKTSVLYQMHRHLDPRYIPVLVDLQGLSMEGTTGFLWELAYTIQRTLRRNRDIKLPRPQRADFAADPRYHFQEVFLPQVREAIGDRHLLLMFDEAVLLEDKVRSGQLEKSIFPFIGSLMQHYDWLNFIFSTGSKLEHLQREYSELFRVALYKKISFLSREDTLALVTQPVRDVYEYDDEALERIYRITSGHPYYTQLLCHSLFTRWEQQDGPVVTATDVEAVLPEVVERGTANLKFVWEDASAEEQAVLAALAEAINRKGRAVTRKEMVRLLEERGACPPPGEVTRALQSLFERDIIGPEEPYEFKVDLLRLWLSEHKKLEWVEQELAEDVARWQAKRPVKLPFWRSAPAWAGTAIVLVLLASLGLNIKQYLDSKKINDQLAAEATARAVAAIAAATARPTAASTATPTATPTSTRRFFPIAPLPTATPTPTPGQVTYPPYIFGIHDRGGEQLMLQTGKPGWVVINEAIGQGLAYQTAAGADYSDLAEQGLGVIVVLVNGYYPDGTLPPPDGYDEFGKRCGEFVRNSRGAHIWVVGHEPNLSLEWPGGEKGQPITPAQYAQAFTACRAAIRSQPGHENDQVVVAAVSPWNVETKYDGNPSGDWIQYFTDVLKAVGHRADGIALHTYTHGSDPELITSDQRMSPPFENRFYQFQAYRDFMEAIPIELHDRPVYITEAGQSDAWADTNSGWVRAAYKEIDGWNGEPGRQAIQAMALYRWAKQDQWGFSDKLGVIADFREAMANEYRVQLPKAAPAYAVSWLEQSFPKSMLTSQEVTVRLRLKNNGTKTWAAGGDRAVRAVFQWYTADGESVVGQAGTFDLPADVPPLQEVTLEGTLRAPSRPGDYVLWGDLVEAGVTTFSEQGAAGLRFQIPVVAPTPTPTPTPTATATPSPTPMAVSFPPPGHIVFTSDRSSPTDLYVMKGDGSGTLRLTDNWGQEADYSPATDRIAFSRHRPGGIVSLYTMDPDGRGVMSIDNRYWDNWEPTFSPDGQRVAFVSSRENRGWEIYTMDIGDLDTNPRCLTCDNPAKDAQKWGPAWSPDGKRIAFVMQNEGDSEYEGQADIWIMDADGTNYEQLTNDDSINKKPAWSPDGKRLVFVSNRDGNFEIYVMDANGHNPINMTNSPFDENGPAWSPDGNWLAFSRRVSARNEDIFVMTIDGVHLTNLTNNNADDWDPIWVP